MSAHETLAIALGHPFADPSLFDEALTHTSYTHEHGGSDYERLEFLGDAVLQLTTTTLLFGLHERAREGELSRLRQRLVNTRALAEIARRLDVGPALRLGAGEDASGGRERPRVLAGAVEALLGAVYLDGGFEAAQRVVERWMAPALEGLQSDAAHGWKDPRSLLQERVQRDLGATPIYDLLATEGPPHLRRFDVEVRVGERVIGRGTGSTKREASRHAASVALECLDVS